MLLFMRIRTFSSALVLMLAVLVGCSGGGRITHQSAEQAFQKGKTAFQNEDYGDAIDYFRAVFQYGRGNQYAADAQYFLGASYREQERYLLAANEFKRFLQLYRNNERAPQVEFERALMYYRLSPHYKLDQSDTQSAISYFQLFIERHPGHELVPKAREHIQTLRSKLAHKKYAAAELYETREMWRAATETYKGIFDQYPDTPWADDALLGTIRSYIEYADRSIQSKRDDRLQKAIDTYNRLAQVFPESPLLNEAEALYSEARSKLADMQQGESLATEEASGGSGN
jgi:outer membrane protein assembly factor BamD